MGEFNWVQHAKANVRGRAVTATYIKSLQFVKSAVDKTD